MKNSSITYNTNSNDDLNIAIETKSNSFLFVAKLLQHSAKFLNDYYNFEFNRQKTLDEDNLNMLNDDYDNISNLNTFQKKYKYISHCPYFNNKLVHCISLECTSRALDSNNNYSLD